MNVTVTVGCLIGITPIDAPKLSLVLSNIYYMNNPTILEKQVGYSQQSPISLTQKIHLSASITEQFNSVSTASPHTPSISVWVFHLSLGIDSIIWWEK